MFKAKLVSLADGQSYSNVVLYKEIASLPKLFEENTLYLYADNNTLIVNADKIITIQLGAQRILSGPNSLDVTRIVLRGEATYFNADILDHEQVVKKGIPEIFPKEHGAVKQLAFTCDDGLFLTHDDNVVSIILNKKIPHVPLKSQNIPNNKISKQDVITANKKIK